ELYSLADQFFALFVREIVVVCGVGENQNIRTSTHQKISADFFFFWFYWKRNGFGRVKISGWVLIAIAPIVLNFSSLKRACFFATVMVKNGNIKRKQAAGLRQG
ncbi:MAG: hypothetical protein EAY75_04395, partial [Bacteroidetes bacterium]